MFNNHLGRNGILEAAEALDRFVEAMVAGTESEILNERIETLIYALLPDTMGHVRWDFATHFKAPAMTDAGLLVTMLAEYGQQIVCELDGENFLIPRQCLHPLPSQQEPVKACRLEEWRPR